MRCRRRRPQAEVPPLAAAPLLAVPDGPAGTVIGVPVVEAVAPQVSEEDLRKAARAGEAARVRLAGAAALPWSSTVSRRGVKVVFVVCRGSLAGGRGRAVFYGEWAEVRGAVCTAAGDIDSGAVFHGFRTTSEARAYWIAAVGDEPWPVGAPHGAVRR